MMKVDYYLGNRPVTPEEKIVYNGIFTQWYEILRSRFDTRTIVQVLKIEGGNSQLHGFPPI